MAGGWTLKRFWKEAVVVPTDRGFAVELDGKPIRTPGKAALVLPTRALAQMVAAEWQAQEAEVRPMTMPATRTANSAIDTVGTHRASIVEDLSGYGGTDLLCYRAEKPAELRGRQAVAWDPLLIWTESRFGAGLKVGDGIVPVSQEPVALAALAAEVARLDDFQLAAFHDLVVLSGSLVIALAVIEGVRSPEEAWGLSRIDEAWQIEQWGEDEEAAESARAKHAAFVHAARFHALCGQANPTTKA
jgi:chaperone required for assembly of F1-ATPase